MGAREKQNDAKREEYMEWLRYPTMADREKATGIRTRSAWAKANHIDRSNLWRWEQDPQFKQDMIHKNLMVFETDQINRVLTKIAQQAEEGKAPQQNMFLKITGITSGGTREKPESDEPQSFEGWSPARIQEWLDKQDEGEIGDA